MVLTYLFGVSFADLSESRSGYVDAMYLAYLPFVSAFASDDWHPSALFTVLARPDQTLLTSANLKAMAASG